MAFTPCLEKHRTRATRVAEVASPCRLAAKSIGQPEDLSGAVAILSAWMAAKCLVHLAHSEPSGLLAISPCVTETSGLPLSTWLIGLHRLRSGKNRRTRLLKA